MNRCELLPEAARDRSKSLNFELCEACAIIDLVIPGHDTA
jgi:hypothetical protein